MNPILAGKFDASSPAGAMAQMGNVGKAGVEGGAASAMAMLAMKKGAAEIQNINANSAKTDAETRTVNESRSGVVEELFRSPKSSVYPYYL